jgi:hypothetical protein
MDENFQELGPFPLGGKYIQTNLRKKPFHIFLVLALSLIPHLKIIPLHPKWM